MNVDVVVIGAGVAGLSAAAALRGAGLGTVVLEAADRIGGRAWTVTLGDAAFDLGASWLHNAEANLLADIARKFGDTVTDADSVRERRRMVGDRPASEAELADFDATWAAFSERASYVARTERDCSLAEAVAPLRDRPWTATVEYWEACLIAAADPHRLSVRDWHVNLLGGTNLDVAGGVGAFVTRRLGPYAGPVQLRTPACRVEWGRRGDFVRVTTDDGPIRASACIVTVSTGVLAGGGIAFDPLLPVDTQDAIANLPMGLLTKIGFPLDAERAGALPSRCSLQRRVEPSGGAVMSFLSRPYDRALLVGFVGGPPAWDLARQGDGAVAAFARAELASVLGADALAGLGAPIVSAWASDPCSRGAYAYATVDHADARARLAQPLADGRLVFAGEAVCTDGLAGTVGGACASGRAAARTVVDALSVAAPV